MNIGANRMAAILTNNAREQRELNIWRQFGRTVLFCCLDMTEPHTPYIERDKLYCGYGKVFG